MDRKTPSNNPEDSGKASLPHSRDSVPADSEPPVSASALSEGIMISQRIIALCLSLILPIGLGVWLGGRWQHDQIGLIVGCLVGFPVALFQMIQLIQWLKSRQPPSRKPARKMAPPQTAPSSPEQEPELLEPDPWDKRWNEKWADVPWEDPKTWDAPDDSL